MTANEIEQYIGSNTFLRKLAYQAIFWTTLREWYIRRAHLNIIKRLPPDFGYLDAGSGLGQHSYFLAQKCPAATITGCEVNPEPVRNCNALARAEALVRLQFRVSDLSQLATDRSYDFIFCGSVLEHIEADQVVLRLFYDLLKTDGYLLIYVPMAEKRILPALKRKLAQLLQESGQKYLHDHVRYYSQPELRAKLTGADFHIEQMTITYGRFGRIAYDIVTWFQYHRFFKFIFVPYLLILHPLVLGLMALDFFGTNSDGNGLMVVARKSDRKRQDINRTNADHI